MSCVTYLALTLAANGLGLLLAALGAAVDEAVMLTFVIVFLKLSNELVPSRLTLRPKSLNNLLVVPLLSE